MPLRILVVEDQAVARKLVVRALAKFGHDFIEAETGERALELVGANEIDVVLLDWALPGIDGIEVCRRLRSDERFVHLYIIMLTSRDGSEDLITALESGADDFAPKPFKVDEMNARLQVAARILELEHNLTGERELAMKYANEMETLAEQRARQLVHADRMATLGVLSAGVAHEINNPVAFIAGNVQILQKFQPYFDKLLTSVGEDDPDSEQFAFIAEELPRVIEGIAIGAGRVARIVQGLKSFSRRDDEPTRREPLDIRQLIENALTLCANALKYNVTVEKLFASKLPRIMGDTQKLEQVFVNLFVNAAQAMEGTAGTLRIAVSADGDQVEIAVEDNGPGITAAALDRIWDPFFTTKSVGKGTGLGLSITQGIVKDHGGAITAGNAENGGARFVISLPAAY